MDHEERITIHKIFDSSQEISCENCTKRLTVGDRFFVLSPDARTLCSLVCIYIFTSKATTKQSQESAHEVPKL